MKKILWAALPLLFASTCSQAQDTPKAEVSVSGSFFYILSGLTIPTGGVSGSVAVNFNQWVGVVGDFGVYHGHPGITSLTGETYTFGPRFSYRKAGRIVPFAQVLVGGSHFSAATSGISGSGSEFAFSIGGGLDFALDKAQKFALRPQADYFGIHDFGSTTSVARLSVGIVYRIGKR